MNIVDMDLHRILFYIKLFTFLGVLITFLFGYFEEDIVNYFEKLDEKRRNYDDYL